MSIGTIPTGAPLNFTASGVVAGGTAMARTYPGGSNNAPSVSETTALAGTILGFFVNTTSSGTRTFTAGTASGGAAITGTITPAAGQWYPLWISSPTGIYCTVGGTINVTFSVDQ
jgi:hypothetical protein